MRVKKLINAIMFTMLLPLGGIVFAQPLIQKEYQVKGDIVVKSAGNIVFAACVYGQQLVNSTCKGVSEKFTQKEIFNAIKSDSLKPWRIPTQEELAPLLQYYANDVLYSKSESYWTSTKLSDGSLRVLSFFKPTFENQTTQDNFSILNGSGSRVQSAQLILVKDIKANETQNYERGRVVGAYIGAADLQTRLASGKCGYVSKKKLQTVDERVRDVKKSATSEVANEIDVFVNSQEFKKKQLENQQMIDGALSRFKADGMDEKTACGALWGSLGLAIHSAEQEWLRSIKK